MRIANIAILVPDYHNEWFIVRYPSNPYGNSIAIELYVILLQDFVNELLVRYASTRLLCSLVFEFVFWPKANYIGYSDNEQRVRYPSTF